MNGKNILVTGASSGIGYITAKYLNNKGYNCILLARSKEKLEVLLSELKGDNIAIPFDLCNLDQIKSVFETCKLHNIKLDGMVHCAGIGVMSPVRLNDINEMERTMKINYFSFVELVKYFCMRQYSNEDASIVAVSSISPLTCYPGACNYAASKNAINASVKVMAKEYMKRRIRVNAVLPGYVNTPLGPSEDDPVYIAQQPLGIIKAEYISYIIYFLLSEKGKYITGTLIPISGGMSY